jgi:hypothetical protein
MKEKNNQKHPQGKQALPFSPSFFTGAGAGIGFTSGSFLSLMVLAVEEAKSKSKASAFAYISLAGLFALSGAFSGVGIDYMIHRFKARNKLPLEEVRDNNSHKFSM